jgi:predicted KAP-like P-loop ATPase
MKSLREEIAEEISGSMKKSKESIEEVYEEIFEDEDLSGSLGKSQNKFKKSVGYKDSDSASKSFRLKTNVIKSIKIADEFNSSKIEEGNSKILIVDKQNEKGSNEISKEKERIKKIQENVASLLAKNKPTASGDSKNKDLLYRFKIELNKLLTSENF